MIEALRSHLRRSGLLPTDARVLVGYSGGADSTCLLVLLHELGYALVAAHLDHGQREESAFETERCREFAERLGVPFVSERSDVPALARDTKVGLEVAGRTARYEFFERASAQYQCDLIATAHTRDDLVETMLLNLTRGTGLRGLGGIPRVRGKVVRPLLPFSRAETRSFCTERGLWFHDDPCNADPDFARTRVRSEVVPALLSLNPRLPEVMAALAEVVREEDALLDDLAARRLGTIEHRASGPLAPLVKGVQVEMDRARLLRLPIALRRRVVRVASRRLGHPFGFEQVAALLTGIEREPKGCVTGEAGAVVFAWTPERVTAVARARLEPFDVPLDVAGTTILPGGWLALRLDVVSARGTDRRIETPSAEMDRDALAGPLRARSPRPGDRWEPTAVGRSQRIVEALRAAGLPSACRGALPIIWDSRGPVAIPGVGVAARARPGPNAAEALRVRLEFSEPSGVIMVGNG